MSSFQERSNTCKNDSSSDSRSVYQPPIVDLTENQLDFAKPEDSSAAAGKTLLESTFIAPGGCAQNRNDQAKPQETSQQAMEKLGLPKLDIIGQSQTVAFSLAPLQVTDKKSIFDHMIDSAKLFKLSQPLDERHSITENAITDSTRPEVKVKPESVDYPGQGQVKLTWDGDKLATAIGVDGNKWERIKEDGKYVDSWRSAGGIWNGKIEFDLKTNDLSYTNQGWPEAGGTKVIFHTSGEKESVSPDGSSRIDFSNNESVTYNKDKIMTSFKSADGTTRSFSDFKSFNASGDLEPTKIKVVTAATATAQSTETNWSLDSSHVWKCEGNPNEHVEFDVDLKRGIYAYDDFNTGVCKRLVPGKYSEVSESEGGETYLKRDNADSTKTVSRWDNQWSVDLKDDHAIRVESEAKVREVSRDDSGAVTSLRDITLNRKWSKTDQGEWLATPLDQSKPYSPPAVAKFSGEVLVDARGLTLVKSAANQFKTLTADGELREASKSENLRGLAAITPEFTLPEKARFAESINNFMERPKLSIEEKENSIEQIKRLMTSTDGGPFSSKEKQVLAAQLSWHLARPFRQEQGPNNTCNVTAIRSAMVTESPSSFSKMIADVGTTGKFITADGSTVTPTVSGMKLNFENLSFPPVPGARSWLGQVSDHTMVNVYWQRMTTDTYGQTVNKGDLTYVQLPGTGDSGERIQRNFNGTAIYQLKNKHNEFLATCPNLGVGNLADIYGQITGRDESNRVIAVPAIINPNETATKVNNEAEFEEKMATGPWPKIIGVHTSNDPFFVDSGYGTAGGAGGRTGGWHVVVAHQYEPKSHRVSVDNSWNTNVDHVIPTKHLTISQLYKASTGAVQ